MTTKKKTKGSAATKKIGKNKRVASSKPSKKQQKGKKAPAVKKQVKPKATKAVAEKKSKKLTPRGKKLQDIRIILVRQRESLLAEAGEALNVLPGQTIFPDMGDQATAETDRNFMLRLRSREQKLLKKIDDALDRIDNGTFGICDECGMEINIRRLEARPVTTLCIECKTQQEEEEKMRES